ncbi:MAG: polymer-forming cytoskeletal protein [Spirochaetota bacterium]|nr:MAG: polymer-forming cytoskeletal protein [Spirochaetota bacterium]
MEKSAQYSHEDAFVNSIIGEGTTLKGEFDLNGLLRIDGFFYGKVKTNGKVLVGKNGIAECDIFAGTIVIGGKVKGSLIASERITLLSTGELIGNIITPRLVIEEGVIFDGTCEIIEDKDRLKKIKDQYFEETAPLKKEDDTKSSEAIVTHTFNQVAETVEKTKIT